MTAALRGPGLGWRIYALGALLAYLGVYAYHTHLQYFVADDGGITLRYAKRLAAGRGLSYNDYEKVNGASAPVWTMVLALALRVGLSPASAVIVLGKSLFAITSLCVLALLARHSVVAGLAALLGFLGIGAFHAAHFTGLETPLTFLLVVLSAAAIASDRQVLAGLALGLLLANKLDGAAALVAYVTTHAVLRRRLPWRALGAALAAALPVWIFLVLEFGSPLPNSALVKARDHATAGGFDPWWMLASLWESSPALVLAAPLALAALVLSERRRAERCFLLIWVTLYVLAYSAIDLGAPYPWYARPPLLMLLLLAGLLVADVEQHLVAALGRRASRLARAGLVAFVGLGAGVTGLVSAAVARITWVPERLPPGAGRDLAGLAAGAWLAQHTSGAELLCTMHGLPALAYSGPVHDYSGLNSAADDARALSASYYIAPESYAMPAPVRDLPVVGVFAYDAREAPYLLYARPESALARAGLFHLPVEVQLPPATDPSGAVRLAGAPVVLGLAATPADAVLRCCIASRSGIDGTTVLTVSADGEVLAELAESRLRPGSVIELALSAGAERRLTLELRGPGAVSVASFRAICGPELAVADFPLMCALWRRSIESVSGACLP